MRSVAALSLVIVVLLGGAVTGTVITDGGSDAALPSDVDVGNDDPSSHDAEQQPPTAADGSDEAEGEETEPTGQQDERIAQGSYADEPSEDLQPAGNETATPSDGDNDSDDDDDVGSPTPGDGDGDENDSDDDDTPAGGDDDDDEDDDDQGAGETPNGTEPGDNETDAEPTETEESDNDSSWAPIFGPSSPTETPEATATPGQSQATFEVVDATLDSNSVSVGEYVEVTAMVENRGNEGGTYEAELQVDNETLATENVFVPGGEVETVAFQVQFENAGEYDIAVSDTDAGTVSVTPREMDGGGEVEVIDAVVPADMVQPGVETTARATVENPSDRQVDATLNVTIDGEVVEETEVSLGSQERTEVTIPFEAQGGTVAVNGVEAGDLQVDESVGNDEAEEAESNEQAGMELGFLVLAAAFVVACAILVAGAVRWRSDDSMLGKLEDRRR